MMRHAQIIIIDELAGRDDVSSCKRIAQQGVSLVATAHAVNLRSLMRNPELNALVGGLSSVTLGDRHAQYVLAAHMHMHMHVHRDNIVKHYPIQAPATQ